MSGAPGLLIAAALGVPLALLVASLLPALRDRLLPLLPLAPLPALVCALAGSAQAPLVLGAGRLRLTFALEAPGAILLGVAALLWTLAGAYAATYLRDDPRRGRFCASWLMAASGCLGAFLAADMVSLYTLLALLTVGAVGLVIHDDTAVARRSATIYFGLALAAESLILIGMVMLAAGTPGDSLLVRDAAAALPTLPQRDWVLALLVVGFGLKAGLFPLHVWMPLAHAAAPVPASAVLSGAVVKVGIIGLGRFVPFDTAMPEWGVGLTAVGLFTALYGVAIGLTQSHPKSVLAYSSVSQMGLIVAVVGMGMSAADPGAALSAAYYASHHVLVKGALFLAVGIVAVTGSKRLWWVLGPVAILALGLGGLPLTGGALAKYAVKGPLGEGLAGTLAGVSAAGTTMLMLHFVHRLHRTAAATVTATAPLGLVLPWAVLAFAALAVPWGMYLSVPAGTVGNPVAPQALWAAAAPMLAGVAVLLALGRWGKQRLPRIPQGDIAAVIEPTTDLARRLAQLCEQADRVLRRWPIATLVLVALAFAFGWALRGG